MSKNLDIHNSMRKNKKIVILQPSYIGVWHSGQHWCREISASDARCLHALQIQYSRSTIGRPEPMDGKKAKSHATHTALQSGLSA
eukprot:m.27929 g.27929  ORF g.27929 m.27929 type:complete len:85 (-) comp8999_c0_seq1:3473-3727(-)